MCPKDAAGIANSVEPDQTGSALFAQNYLSENLGSLQYDHQTSLNPYLPSGYILIIWKSPFLNQGVSGVLFHFLVDRNLLANSVDPDQCGI